MYEHQCFCMDIYSGFNDWEQSNQTKQSDLKITRSVVTQKDQTYLIQPVCEQTQPSQ